MWLFPTNYSPQQTQQQDAKEGTKVGSFLLLLIMFKKAREGENLAQNMNRVPNILGVRSRVG